VKNEEKWAICFKSTFGPVRIVSPGGTGQLILKPGNHWDLTKPTYDVTWSLKMRHLKSPIRDVRRRGSFDPGHSEPDSTPRFCKSSLSRMSSDNSFPRANSSENDILSKNWSSAWWDRRHYFPTREIAGYLGLRLGLVVESPKPVELDT
jgi:hypothetical protein